VSAQAHQSDVPTLERRTLARDHRRLAALLRPGMRVLDVEDEIACRGEDGFDGALEIWQRVIVTMGPTMIEARAIDRTAVDAAAHAADDWCRHTARRQHMVLRAAVGRRPEGGTP
jgi:hypothetical protein